ncbi:MAG: hypothetical protein JWP27_2191 [Flaviaesturariibacter sp.]|nr:hypothetical protein [Flaviaesturariibacter sp.]
MHTLPQPALQPTRIVIQPHRFGNAALVEPGSACQCLDEIGLLLDGHKAGFAGASNTLENRKKGSVKKKRPQLQTYKYKKLYLLKLPALRKLVAACLLVTLCSNADAQKKEVFKFEKITPEVLQRKIYPVDSNASAVVLGDVGSTEIIGNTKGWFSFTFRRHVRTHILKKAGYDEAQKAIMLYVTSGAQEKLEALKATTYNLENGQVVETKMDKDNVFTEKAAKYQFLKKFTLPNVKEGCIIDIEYRIVSDYLNTLQPWNFQGAAPRLWSEYTLSVPQFFEYSFISRGSIPFYISDRSNRMDQFNIVQTQGAEASDRVSFTANVTDYRWVAKDVPAFKPESYLSSSSNYSSHIEFQLAAQRDPLQYHNYIGSWPEMTQNLMNDEDFGKKLDKNNNWLSDVVKPLIASGTNQDKARRIYAYVRDNFTCTSPEGLYLSQPLRNILRTKAGSVSEINLLLASMLKYADIPAEPIMLSTRSNGFVYTLFPMLSRFNYIVTSATIDGQRYYLDASQPHMGFGHLPTECYNGMARVINETATPLNFTTDSLKERKMTSILLINDDKGSWVGTMQQVAGYYESEDIRATIKDKGKEQYFKDLKKGFGLDISMTNQRIDSLTQYDHPVAVYYDFKVEAPKEDIMYVSPLFGEATTENPFKSAERSYPVEMPYAIDESFNVTMYVPEGYVVDELPKSMRVKFNDAGEGMFEYMISQSNDVISLRTQVKFTRANFQPDEYEILREFFNMIVSKQKEQIVFKKKK